MRSPLLYSAVTLLFLVPSAAYAAPKNFEEFVNLLIGIINNAIVPLLFAIAFVIFIWGVFRYFIADTTKAKEDGRTLLVWGLLALAVMASVWGLVAIVVRTLFP